MRLNLANNFGTELAEDISDTITSFEVVDLSDTPDTPYRMTIHEGEPADGEIIEVTSHDKANNQITECQRGMEDTTAQSWDAGDEIEQFSTAGVYEGIDADKADNPHDNTQHIEDYAIQGDLDKLESSIKSEIGADLTQLQYNYLELLVQRELDNEAKAGDVGYWWDLLEDESEINQLIRSHLDAENRAIRLDENETDMSVEWEEIDIGFLADRLRFFIERELESYLEIIEDANEGDTQITTDTNATPSIGDTLLIIDKEYEITGVTDNTSEYIIDLGTGLNQDVSSGTFIELRVEPFDLVTEVKFDDGEFNSSEVVGARIDTANKKVREEHQIEGEGEKAQIKVNYERPDDEAIEVIEATGEVTEFNSSPITDHTDFVWSVFIKDNILVSGSADNDIRLYDISDPDNVTEFNSSPLTDHTDTVNSVYIKDNILVSGSNDDEIRLHDISNPDNVTEFNSSPLTDHTSNVLSVFIKDNILVSGSDDNDIRLYDISDLDNITEFNSSPLEDHAASVYSVFIKDNILVSGSADNDIRLYDISDPDNVVEFNSSPITDHTAEVNSVYIKDNILVSGSLDNDIRLYDISDPDNVTEFNSSPITDHTDDVYPVYIKDNILVSGSADNDIRLYDISDPDNVTEFNSSPLTDHTATVLSVFIKDNILVSGSVGEDIRLHDQDLLDEVITYYLENPRAIFGIK